MNWQCPNCGSKEVIAWELGRQSRKTTGIALIVAVPAVFVSGYLMLTFYSSHSDDHRVGNVLFVLLILVTLAMLVMGVIAFASRKRTWRCKSCGHWQV